MNKKAKRWVLPFDAWPERHRDAWQTAIDPGDDVFTDAGLASHWTEKTQRQIIKDYGMWLKQCLNLDPAVLASPEPISLTRDTLRPYVTGLRDRLASVSVCSRLRGLSEAYRVMWPEVDRARLRKLLSRLHRNAAPSRNKTAALISSREILGGSLCHMETVFKAPAPSETIRACWVRNALMVALLALHPIRLANLTQIRLGQHMTQEDDQVWLRFSSQETKEKRPLEFLLASILFEPLQVYLETYRPVLLDGRDSEALWISVRKTAMADRGVYDQVVRTTKKLFGHPINPHLFRDCAMTTLATEDPAHVRVGARLLGHSSLRTGEDHYNQATMASAVTQYHEALAQLRGSEPPTEEINT